MEDLEITSTRLAAPEAASVESSGSGWRIALLAALVFLAGGELASRLFWAIKCKVPPYSARMLRYAQYPSLYTSGVETAHLGRTGASYDILVLGGSTMSSSFSTIAEDVKVGLSHRLKRPVRLFNLAYAAHNSRDSVLKYRWLAGQHFDLVLLYDGISDARMDNVPPDLYRDDYSHCHWYQLGNRLDEHPRLFAAALPYTILFGVDRLVAAGGWRFYVPQIFPRAKWTTYGRTARSAESFKRNISEILDLARTRRDRVVLMTFASYIPPGYSREAAAAGKVLYTNFKGAPVEMIGDPKNVAAALAHYNAALRDMARAHPEVVLVDQERLIPADGKTFMDCCHLETTGMRRFSRNILDALQ